MASKVIFAFIFAAVLFNLLQNEAVSGQSTTKEPNEKEQFTFFYDRNTHKMAMKVNHVCYVLDLTPSEQLLVHTPSGLQQLELKMVYNMNTATKTPTTMEALTAMSKQIAHGCAHTDTQYIMTI